MCFTSTWNPTDASTWLCKASTQASSISMIIAGLDRTECWSCPVGLYSLEPSTTSDRVAESPVGIVDISRYYQTRLESDDAVPGIDWDDRSGDAR